MSTGKAAHPATTAARRNRETAVDAPQERLDRAGDGIGIGKLRQVFQEVAGVQRQGNGRLDRGFRGGIRPAFQRGNGDFAEKTLRSSRFRQGRTRRVRRRLGEDWPLQGPARENRAAWPGRRR